MNVSAARKGVEEKSVTIQMIKRKKHNKNYLNLDESNVCEIFYASLKRLVVFSGQSTAQINISQIKLHKKKYEYKYNIIRGCRGSRLHFLLK